MLTNIKLYIGLLYKVKSKNWQSEVLTNTFSVIKKFEIIISFLNFGYNQFLEQIFICKKKSIEQTDDC